MEQLLLASAAAPTESEQAFTGASALASGRRLPRRVRPGGGVLPGQQRAAELVRQGRDRSGGRRPADEGSGSEAWAAARVGVAEPVACATAAADRVLHRLHRRLHRGRHGGRRRGAGGRDTHGGTGRQHQSALSRFRWTSVGSASRSCSFSCLRGTQPALKPAPCPIPGETRSRGIRANVRDNCDCTTAAMRRDPCTSRRADPVSASVHTVPGSGHGVARTRIGRCDAGAARHPRLVRRRFAATPVSGGSTGSASLLVAGTTIRCPTRTARSAPRACARRSACTPPARSRP